MGLTLCLPMGDKRRLEVIIDDGYCNVGVRVCASNTDGGAWHSASLQKCFAFRSVDIALLSQYRRELCCAAQVGLKPFNPRPRFTRFTCLEVRIERKMRVRPIRRENGG